VWKEYVSKAVDIYDRMSRYEGKEGAVVVYGSMYGNTERMAEAVAQGLTMGGIKNVILHNVSKSDASVILRDIFKYKGLVLGSPTYSNELYPEIDSLLKKMEIRGIKKRDFAYFGSFTWAGIANKKLAEFGEKMKWRTINFTVEEKMGLKDSNYQSCILLGRKTAELLKTPEPVDPSCH
jgi:flavorubredoxin